MRPNALRRSFWLTIALALVLILMVQFVELVEIAKVKNAIESKSNKNDNPESISSIIDWKTYKATFNKRYSTLSQQLVRHKLFVMHLIKVFLTAIKFKINEMSYYLVINRYSDMAPNEERRMFSGESDDSKDDDGELMDDDQIGRVLQAELDDRVGSGASVDSSSPSSGVKQRAKRSTDSEIEAVTPLDDKPDELNMADLVRAPAPDGNKSERQKLNIKWVVPSNNPDYVPVEAFTNGMPQETNYVEDIPRDQVEKIANVANNWGFFALPRFDSLNDITKKTYDKIMHNDSGPEPADSPSSSSSKKESKRASAGKPSTLPPNPNVVIKDWRDSGCIAPPYDQYKTSQCNSCYAVSAMSFVEWAFCMNQGRVLTPLSAQYFVSCGPQFMEESKPKLNVEFYGCLKGRSKQAMYFVKEYGVELEANMPYLGIDTGCPVDPNTPPKHKGYIRPNVKQSVRMLPNTKQLELALDVGPVIVNFREPIDFMAYGGGLLQNCYQDGWAHAMLVVGHGVESNIPYLIIKNSFGTDWGMKGYFKFDRRYTKECVVRFMLPRISFPSKKAQIRRIKAYDANKAGPTKSESNDFEINLEKLAES